MECKTHPGEEATAYCPDTNVWMCQECAEKHDAGCTSRHSEGIAKRTEKEYKDFLSAAEEDKNNRVKIHEMAERMIKKLQERYDHYMELHERLIVTVTKSFESHMEPMKEKIMGIKKSAEECHDNSETESREGEYEDIGAKARNIAETEEDRLRDYGDFQTMILGYFKKGDLPRPDFDLDDASAMRELDELPSKVDRLLSAYYSTPAPLPKSQQSSVISENSKAPMMVPVPADKEEEGLAKMEYPPTALVLPHVEPISATLTCVYPELSPARRLRSQLHPLNDPAPAALPVGAAVCCFRAGTEDCACMISGGSFDFFHATGEVWLYSFKEKRVSRGQNMRVERENHCMVEVKAKGVVVALGGWNHKGESMLSVEYISTDKLEAGWSLNEKLKLSICRDSSSACVAGTTIYVVGGYKLAKPAIDVLDLAGDTSVAIELGSLPDVYGCETLFCNPAEEETGRKGVLIFGGYEGGKRKVMSKKTFLFDPEKKEVVTLKRELARPSAFCSQCSPVRVGDGKIFVFGSGSVLHVYEAGTKTWKASVAGS